MVVVDELAPGHLVELEDLVMEVDDLFAQDLDGVGVGFLSSGGGVGEQGDGEDGELVADGQVAVVVEHPLLEVPLWLGLVLEVDEEEHLVLVDEANLSQQVDLPFLGFVAVGFVAEEFEAGPVDAALEFGEEEFDEFLEECGQQFFEDAVVVDSHRPRVRAPDDEVVTDALAVDGRFVAEMLLRGGRTSCGRRDGFLQVVEGDSGGGGDDF